MTELVGILNVTPDSFSDGGQYESVDAAIEHAQSMFAAGVALVDVGAESTRPGAEPLAPEEEWQRLSPILERLLQLYPTVGRRPQLSVDTYHAETACWALALGDVIINDITGMSQPAMREAVIDHEAMCIVSHSSASSPQAAHQGELVSDVKRVKTDLLERAQQLEAGGLPRDHIILDPGIGFGKTSQLNWELLGFAQHVPEYQVMIGHSKKRFLGENRTSDDPDPDKNPNLAAARIAIQSGAAYLRVHDVDIYQQLLH